MVGYGIIKNEKGIKMNLEDYLRSITPTAILTFAIIALAMAILIHSQVQMSKRSNKGKSK